MSFLFKVMHMVGKTRRNKEFSNLSVKVDSVCGSLEKWCPSCTALWGLYYFAVDCKGNL